MPVARIRQLRAKAPDPVLTGWKPCGCNSRRSLPPTIVRRAIVPEAGSKRVERVVGLVLGRQIGIFMVGVAAGRRLDRQKLASIEHRDANRAGGGLDLRALVVGTAVALAREGDADDDGTAAVLVGGREGSDAGVLAVERPLEFGGHVGVRLADDVRPDQGLQRIGRGRHLEIMERHRLPGRTAGLRRIHARHAEPHKAGDQKEMTHASSSR